ncbi:MAG: ABC transporter permease [Eubacteriales bacterium]
MNEMVRTQSKFLRELNAVIAVTAREITVALKSPGSIIMSFAMPIVMMGMIGGNLMENMTSGLGFDFGKFMLVGMLVNTLFMLTANGVASLVDDHDSNFSEEMLVAPVSRYSIVIGKICGAMFTSIVSLIGTLIIGFVMGITLTVGQLLAVLALAPLICLSAGALVMIFIGFIRKKTTANMMVMLIVMSQMFLSGAVIPINNSHGVLMVLSRILPMTYCLDLARAAVYSGTTEYSSIVMFNPAVTFAVIVALTFIFLIIGTFFFARSEKNR